MDNLLNLSPFAVIIFRLAAWSQLWGIPGDFRAAPSTAIMTVVASEYQGTRTIAVPSFKNRRI